MKPTAEDLRTAQTALNGWDGQIDELVNRIADALAAEREKAAEILENKATVWDKEFNDLRSQRKQDNQSRNVKALAARQCAAAIRVGDKE